LLYNISREINVKIVTIPLIGAVLAIGTAQATPFSNVLAWERIYNTQAFDDSGVISMDAGSNCYLWYRAVETSNTPMRLSRISPTGSVYLSQYLTLDLGSAPIQVMAAPDNYIYAGSDDILGMTPKFGRISKYGAGLNLIFNHDFSVTGDLVLLTAFDVDKVGNVSAVLEHQAAGVPRSDFVQFNSSNVVTQNAFTASMIGFTANHVGSKWLLNGSKPNLIDPMWGFFDQATGTASYSESKTNDIHFTGPGTVYSYWVAPVPGTLNAVVVLQTTVTQDGNPTSISFNVREITPTGGVLWQSPTIDQAVLGVYPQGENKPVYVACTGQLVEMTNGATQFSKAFPSGTMFFDSTGFFNVTTTPQSVTYARYDLNADQPAQWINVVYGNAALNSAKFAGAVLRGPVFIGVANPYNASTGYDLDLRRYISGPTLSTILADHGNTVQSGNTGILKLSLTGVAPPGGLSITLTSNNPKLLFSNNTQTITVAIPNGSNALFVPVHALNVASQTSVTVTGNYSGLLTNDTLPINP
jgi:hypothetical protein